MRDPNLYDCEFEWNIKKKNPKLDVKRKKIRRLSVIKIWPDKINVLYLSSTFFFLIVSMQWFVLGTSTIYINLPPHWRNLQQS